MKKGIKITGIILGVLILFLALTPFLFRGKLEDLLKKTVNNNVNAQVTWASLDLSLFRSFPDATVVINDLTIINNEPFAGDTLGYGKRLEIKMGVKQLFKDAGSEPIEIDALKLEEAAIHIEVNENGETNYDIAKTTQPTSSSEPTDNTTPFVFNLQKYELINASIVYDDYATRTHFELSEVYHTGSGDFSAIAGELDTNTEAIVSFDYEDVHYLDGHILKLDAKFQMDLENQKYTFKKNKGFINALPLEFEGFVQILEEATSIDLSFKTPDSDFKNFLAVIPQTYRKNLDGVETSGDFRVSGLIKGKATEETIPTLDIAIISNNASFKYPDLPKRMNNINIDVKIKNDSGIADLTYIEINDLRFKIDEDLFSATGTLRNLTGNMLVNLALKGALDLENIEKVYPLGFQEPLNGRVVADMTTSFDMNSVEKQQYQNIKSNGITSLSDFTYNTPEFLNPINISTAEVAFKEGTIMLNKFTASSGKTDMNATGTIENLIPFLMSREDLKGRFDVASKVFDLNDFATAETTTTGQGRQTKTVNTDEKAVQIPDFLDAAISFKANTVIYDNLELKNASGKITIANEEASISGLKSGIFGGDAGLSGTVSTKSGIPTFDMMLDLNSIDIDRSFSELDMMKGIAPIAKALQGAINTKVNLKGTLDANLSPILSSISGDAFAQILTGDVNTDKMPLLNLLDSKLDFINLDDVDLKGLKTTLNFKDGNVVVTPFDFDVKGIKVTVDGGHSFTNQMAYNLSLDVPARYMGGDVTNLLSKLTAKEKENLHVDLPVSLSGNFAQPKVNLNLKAATTALTAQIIEIQKQRVKDKVEDKLEDVLGNIIGGNNTNTETTTGTGSTKPSSDEVIKDVASDLLGGLFGKKKKTKNTKKDSVN